MKIRMLPQSERAALKSRWHRHFALFPVRTTSKEIRWLETVERIGRYEWFGHASWGWDWSYRAISK